jgi:hypothetical protein
VIGSVGMRIYKNLSSPFIGASQISLNSNLAHSFVTIALRIIFAKVVAKNALWGAGTNLSRFARAVKLPL